MSRNQRGSSLTFALVATLALLLPLLSACAPAPAPAKPTEPAKPAEATKPAVPAPVASASPSASPGAVAPAAPAAPAAASGPATGQPIKIGFVWGVTGAVAEIVRPNSEAVKAYFDWANKNGGVKGRPLEMVEVDSQYKVPLAQEGYKKVTSDDKVPLVVLASTGDTLALAPQINQDKVVAITYSCGQDWRPEKNPFIFTNCTYYEDQMASSLQFIKNKEGEKAIKVAFTYPDIPFGLDPIPAGREYAKKLNFNLVGEEKVGAADVDATSQALNLKNLGPDYIINNNVTAGGSAIVRSAKQAGLNAQFINLNYAFDEPTVKAIGPQAAEGLIGVGVTAFPSPDLELMKDIQTNAPQIKEIGQRTIQGWSLAMMLVDSLRRADSYDGPGILKAMEKVDIDVKGAVPGGRWVYTDKLHAPTRKSTFYQVKDGKIIRISDPIDPPAR
jgi:branched-chain amino acid transport system substrate-binding protein